jgi:hypothetical protein
MPSFDVVGFTFVPETIEGMNGTRMRIEGKNVDT